jgi:hypothetical protein
MERYYKRFRPTGEPFYVSESGELVQESVAMTNLIPSRRAELFEEEMSFGVDDRRTARSQSRRVTVNVREAMESAFMRHLIAAHPELGEKEDSPPELSVMEEAFARLRPARI